MPKVTYTKAKGLFQESGTGFIHTEVPFTQEGKLMQPVLAKYVIHCGVAGEAPTATKLHNAVLNYKASDGSQRNIVIKGAATPALVTPTNDIVADISSFAGTAEDILNEIGKTFCETVGNNQEYAYEAATSSGSGFELVIHALKPHAGAIPSLDLTQGTTVGDVSNASRSNSVLQVKRDDSYVGSDNSLDSNSHLSHKISQTKSATTAVIDIATGDLAHNSPNKLKHNGTAHNAASFTATGFTLENGTALGQRIYLINRSTTRNVSVGGTMQTAAGSAATACVLAAGEVQQLIWNGSKWAEAAAVSGSPSVS